MCSMVTTVLFTLVSILQNVLVNSKPVETDTPVPNLIEDTIYNVQAKMAMQFPKGIVLYFIDSKSYDSIIKTRIQRAMDVIEASSCVVFNQMSFTPSDDTNGSWIHFTNPTDKRNCVHKPVLGDNGEIMIVIGFDCMTSTNILHAVLHAIGFKDEVAHPHRDQYINILWENIQPEYRTLFHKQTEDAPHKVVEYDPMSIMHFQDRAFSINGGPTIVPRIPGLVIAPSEKLSQLDVMKLRIWFGHECNKRKVGELLDKCKIVFRNSQQVLKDNFIGYLDADESVEADDDDSYQNDASYVNSGSNNADGGDYSGGNNDKNNEGGGDYGGNSHGGGDYNEGNNGKNNQGGGDYGGGNNDGGDNEASDYSKEGNNVIYADNDDEAKDAKNKDPNNGKGDKGKDKNADDGDEHTDENGDEDNKNDKGDDNKGNSVDDKGGDDYEDSHVEYDSKDYDA